MSRLVEMDMMCELASDIVEYIVTYHTDIPLAELEVTEENGDLRYSDRVQDIFNEVLDIVDEDLNGEEE